jgi:aryl-alcohol dehydrogenase-like predicted oxidoreductase
VEHVEIAGLPAPVSRVGLGTWAIAGPAWGDAEEAEAIRTIHAALDLGVNLVDTAPIYGLGRAEEIVGRALATSGRRDRVMVATKLGLDWSAGPVRRDLSPARVARELEDSLRRLRIEAVDLYQVHRPDGATPLEPTARALEALVRAGKVRAVGVVDFSPAQVDALAAGVRVASAQAPYDLLERAAEAGVLPHCRGRAIPLIAYGILCRGLLSGRMSPATTFAGDDLRREDPKFQPPRYLRYLAAVAELDAFARQVLGRTALELAVRWVLDRPGVSVALWGARRPSQLDPLPRVLGWTLDPAALARIEEIVRTHLAEPQEPRAAAPPGPPSAPA